MKRITKKILNKYLYIDNNNIKKKFKNYSID